MTRDELMVLIEELDDALDWVFWLQTSPGLIAPKRAADEKLNDGAEGLTGLLRLVREHLVKSLERREAVERRDLAVEASAVMDLRRRRRSA